MIQLIQTFEWKNFFPSYNQRFISKPHLISWRTNSSGWSSAAYGILDSTRAGMQVDFVIRDQLVESSPSPSLRSPQGAQCETERRWMMRPALRRSRSASSSDLRHRRDVFHPARDAGACIVQHSFGNTNAKKKKKRRKRGTRNIAQLHRFPRPRHHITQRIIYTKEESE